MRRGIRGRGRGRQRVKKPRKEGRIQTKRVAKQTNK